MLEFGYVLYQVHPVDADGPGPTVNLDFQATVDCQGQVIKVDPISWTVLGQC